MLLFYLEFTKDLPYRRSGKENLQSLGLVEALKAVLCIFSSLFAKGL